MSVSDSVPCDHMSFFFRGGFGFFSDLKREVGSFWIEMLGGFKYFLYSSLLGEMVWFHGDFSPVKMYQNVSRVFLNG